MRLAGMHRCRGSVKHDDQTIAVQVVIDTFGWMN